MTLTAARRATVLRPPSVGTATLTREEDMVRADIVRGFEGVEAVCGGMRRAARKTLCWCRNADGDFGRDEITRMRRADWLGGRSAIPITLVRREVDP